MALLSRSPGRRWAKPLRRIVVAGDSMRPTLHPGDRLVVLGLARVRTGDLVVVRDPSHPFRVLVKRAVVVGRDGIEVGGDNPAASTDSRGFGIVPHPFVLGRAVYRYSPAARSGRLRRVDPTSAPLC